MIDDRPRFISTQVHEGRYFFLDLTPPPESKLSVICGGREQCKSGYEIDRSGFQYHAIELVAAGRGELTLGDLTYDLKPGAVFMYGPKIAHRIKSVGSKRLVKYFVDFSGAEASGWFEDEARDVSCPLQLLRSRWILDIFDQMIDAGGLPKPTARRQCEMLLRLLLMRLDVDAQPIGEVSSPAFETYCRCRSHIEDGFQSIAGVHEVARACDVSPEYLSRLFKRYAQEGPLQYLTRLKMDYAADLLTRHGFSVKDAAEGVGYVDPYHFSRVFKRMHGLAPRDFVRSVLHRRGG